MATLPPVAGLLKHQIYFVDNSQDENHPAVMTLWTWKNENPVAPARVTYELGVLDAWLKSATFRAKLGTNVFAQWIRSWDMGQTPPTRVGNLLVWPVGLGTGGNQWVSQVTAVIALRTQAVGSSTRNRLNGRLHHPYPPVGEMTGTFWSSSFMTSLVTVYNVVLNGLSPATNAVSGDWVVPCHYENGALRVGGPLLPPVNHVLVRQRPGTVRSRAPRLGPYARGA